MGLRLQEVGAGNKSVEILDSNIDLSKTFNGHKKKRGRPKKNSNNQNTQSQLFEQVMSQGQNNPLVEMHEEADSQKN